MHGIGNPPFGHFGEAAINDWFRQRLAPGDALGQPLTDDRAAKCRPYAYMTERHRLMRCAVKCAGICNFEGNAQGIRLVLTLMRMNLTGRRWDVSEIYSSGVVV